MKKIITLIMAACIAFTGLFGAEAFASSGKEICNNSYADKNSAAYKMYCGDGDESDAEAVVQSILETVFFWTGIVAVIVIIIGGIFYITSQGEPGKVAKAKTTILYAVIGLIISLSAFAIVHFVLSKMGG